MLHALAHSQDIEDHRAQGEPTLRPADLRRALREGWRDFLALKTHNVVLAVIYPVVGALIAVATAGGAWLHMLFPLAAGFALLGPAAAIGPLALSRRRERGQPLSLAAAARDIRTAVFGPAAGVLALLAALFVLWLATAHLLYAATLGPSAPDAVATFAADLFATEGGWALIITGNAVGLLFALAALAVGTFSLPLVLDGERNPLRAVALSVRAARANAGATLLWGLAVAAGLLLGSLPLFMGLAVVLPVLAHANWRLYRAAFPQTSS